MIEESQQYEQDKEQTKQRETSYFLSSMAPNTPMFNHTQIIFE